MPRGMKHWADLQIGAFTVPIMICPKKSMVEGNRELLGCAKVSYMRPAILISDELTGRGRESVLLHETLHMCADLTGTNLSERDVEVMTTVLFQAFNSFKLRKPAPRRRKSGR